jgi:AcrR family transcriptional regulator
MSLKTARSRRKDFTSAPQEGREDLSRRERILAAALEQFAEKGFAAVRIDELAASAGANKQLIYYYFGGKSELYDAAFDRLIELTAPSWAELEAAPTLALAIQRFRQQDSPADVIWHRFLAWEGVEQAGRDKGIRLEQVRTETWQRLVKVVQKAQARGELAENLDAGMFALLLTSFIGTPLVLPQLAKMITRTEPDSDEFARRQGGMFDALLEALRP